MENKRILIVEDDSDTRLAYQVALTARHYETFFAKDPLSCLWEAHRHRPDLILLDLGLVAGDGFRAMDQLKAAPHLSGIPIVVVSARSAQEFKGRALQSGAKAYLQKPIEQAQLLTIIAELIGQPAQTSDSGSLNARRLAEADT